MFQEIIKRICILFTDQHEGELVMAYNVNTNNKTMHPRAFYALYIGWNESGTDHLVFKLSINQLLNTPKCEPVHMPENIIQAVNEMGTITNKILLNHFDSDQHII